jgi:hypothetical protein
MIATILCIKKRFNNIINKDRIQFSIGLWIRIQLNSDTDPEQSKFFNLDPDTILIQNRIGIKKKGLIRIWIRIQQKTDPQPCYKPYPVFVDCIYESFF